jgi:AcrR family transcriptional regulator
MTRRAGLDQRSVINAAIKLADQAGLEQLTMATLAKRLGIQTPSLYNFVNGLPGLRRELALEGFRELRSRLQKAAVGKTTDAAVTGMADAYRAFAKEHPGLYAATIRSPRITTPRDAELMAVERELLGLMLAVMASYGLKGKTAIHASRGLRSLMHGFVTLEAGGGFGIPADIDRSFRQLIRVYLDGLGRQKHTQSRK